MKKKESSKQADVLQHFLKGGRLTVLGCIKLFHTTELRKLVARLKRQGYDIQGKYYTDKEGNRNIFKTYYLSRTLGHTQMKAKL